MQACERIARGRVPQTKKEILPIQTKFQFNADFFYNLVGAGGSNKSSVRHNVMITIN